MLSEYAIATIDDLQKQGCNLTPADIIRLNALGLKIERGPDAAAIYSRRRAFTLVAPSGVSLTLREPTIAQALYYTDLRTLPELDALGNLSTIVCRAYSLYCDPPPSPRPQPKDEVAAVAAFVAGPLAPFSLRQIVQAIDYCLNGNDAATAESPAPEPIDEQLDADDDAKFDAYSYEISLVHRAEALRLGISYDDALKHTPAQLEAIIERALDDAYLAAPPDERAAFFRERKNAYIAQFERTADEIRMRNPRNGI